MIIWTKKCKIQFFLALKNAIFGIYKGILTVSCYLTRPFSPRLILLRNMLVAFLKAIKDKRTWGFMAEMHFQAPFCTIFMTNMNTPPDPQSRTTVHESAPPPKVEGGGGVLNAPPPHSTNEAYWTEIYYINHRLPCSEVLCLGIVTFEQGVAWLTGSYSMAVRPIEEHPCALRGKGTQIKYATRVLRALLHAKPNISPFSLSVKFETWCHM